MSVVSRISGPFEGPVFFRPTAAVVDDEQNNSNKESERKALDGNILPKWN